MSKYMEIPYGFEKMVNGAGKGLPHRLLLKEATSVMQVVHLRCYCYRIEG